jgi:hypothetical protein
VTLAPFGRGGCGADPSVEPPVRRSVRAVLGLTVSGFRSSMRAHDHQKAKMEPGQPEAIRRSAGDERASAHGGRIVSGIGRLLIPVAIFTVLLAAACGGGSNKASGARLVVSPADGLGQGDTILISVCGFKPREIVQVFLGDRSLATAGTDQTGSWKTLTVLPYALPAGPATMSVASQDGATRAEAKLTLRASGAATPVRPGTPAIATCG